MTHDKLITCTFAKNRVEGTSNMLVGFIPPGLTGPLVLPPSVLHDNGQ